MPASLGCLLHACLPPSVVQVLGQISRFSKRVGGCTQVLLVPSTRDVHHHPVLPQPPLDELQAAAQSATALANPVTLRCNEAVVGVGAADWLMACIREEMPLSVAANERLTALAAHLPAQSSYFPIFPPPLGTPLDCSKAGAALDMPYAPDLLLLPSDLAPFAKLCPLHQLDRAAASAAQAALAAASGNAETAAAAATAPQSRAVCINPGRLTKGASGAEACPAACLPSLLPVVAVLLLAIPLWPANAPMQAAPLPTSIFCRCPRRWMLPGGHCWRPMHLCCTSWTSGAASRSSAFKDWCQCLCCNCSQLPHSPSLLHRLHLTGCHQAILA